MASDEETKDRYGYLSPEAIRQAIGGGEMMGMSLIGPTIDVPNNLMETLAAIPKDEQPSQILRYFQAAGNACDTANIPLAELEKGIVGEIVEWTKRMVSLEDEECNPTDGDYNIARALLARLGATP